MTLSQPAGTGTQKVNFKLYALLRDHFPFGYTPADTARPVERVFEVEVIIENFVTSSITFTLHAPPEVLNAIIQERYDVVRQVYEIDVIKVVQSHFTIEALAFYATSAFPATLVKDVYGDGTTDRIEVVTPPPCSIPSTFRIAYDIRCNGMICRDNTWNYDEVIFAVPKEEMCPSVSVTYAPSMTLETCADALCAGTTPDHILGYVMTVKATVTMVPPILLTRFYDVKFTDVNLLSKYVKQSAVVTSFGNFVSYTDVEGGSDGESTFDFVPRKGSGVEDFFKTPDIFTSANYDLEVVMYVEADLTQSVAGRFTTAVAPTAESYGRASAGFGIAYTADGFKEVPEEDSSNTTVIVVCVVSAAVVVAALSAVFVVKRRSVLKQAETHLEMTA
jgi:hypothetical protein